MATVGPMSQLLFAGVRTRDVISTHGLGSDGILPTSGRIQKQLRHVGTSNPLRWIFVSNFDSDPLASSAPPRGRYVETAPLCLISNLQVGCLPAAHCGVDVSMYYIAEGVIAARIGISARG